MTINIKIVNLKLGLVHLILSLAFCSTIRTRLEMRFSVGLTSLFYVFKGGQGGIITEETLKYKPQPQLFLWYMSSIKNAAKTVYLLTLKNLDYFSIPMLLKTLFQPWKRDVMSTQGLSLNDKFRIWIFNLMSRIIGAIIRIFTIIFGLILSLFLFIFGFVAVMVWAVFPLIILFLFIYGAIMMVQ